MAATRNSARGVPLAGHGQVRPFPPGPILGWQGWPAPTDFAYAPLPTPTSIRLLSVVPAEPDENETRTYWNGNLKIDWDYVMTVVDLDDAPQYAALSYTWGDPFTVYRDPRDVLPAASWLERFCSINVNGTPVSITPNLYSALAAVGSRAGPSSCPIWADAVCINQRDLGERAAQVRLMGRIYRGAVQTPVWLGAFENDFFNTMEGIESLRRIRRDQYPHLLPQLITDDATYHRLGIPIVSIEGWLGIYMFLSRSWFKRIWVLQELSLSRRPVQVIGGVSGSFESLAKLSDMLSESGWWYQMNRLIEPLIDTGRRPSDHVSADIRARYPSIRLHRSFVSRSNERSIVDSLMYTYATTPPRASPDSMPRFSPEVALLDRHRHSEATDLRDKVYAILGVCAEYPSSNIRVGDFRVDYSASVQDVYTEVVRHIIATSSTLSILSIKEPEPVLAGLPSWVPDFTTAPWIYSVDERLLRQQASAGFARQTSYHNSARLKLWELPVSAISIGTVSHILNLASWLGAVELVDLVHHCVAASRHEQSIRPMTCHECLRTIVFAVTNQDTLQVRDRMINDVAIKLSRRMVRAAAHMRLFQIDNPSDDYLGFNVKTIQSDLESLRLLQTWCEGDENLAGDERGSPQPALVWTRGRFGGPVFNLPAPLDDLRVDFDLCVSERDLSIERSRVLGEIGKREPDHKLQRLHQDPRPWMECSDMLFITACGHIGLGYERVTVGDEVFILAGADIPMVLRPLRGGRYSLVGPAKIPGLMDGEAITEDSIATARDMVLV